MEKLNKVLKPIQYSPLQQLYTVDYGIHDDEHNANGVDIDHAIKRRKI